MDFDFLPVVKESGRRKDGIRICAATRFLDWCDEEEIDIVESWSEHFTKKGINHIVGLCNGRASIWREGMVEVKDKKYLPENTVVWAFNNDGRYRALINE